MIARWRVWNAIATKAEERGREIAWWSGSEWTWLTRPREWSSNL